MATKNTLEQMLEHLVNDEKAKAEELFHEYVVAKSREIYETLIEAEVEEEDEDKDDEEVDENFEAVEYGADASDEEPSDIGGDTTDDLASELDADDESEFGDEEGEKEPVELFQDLDSIVGELQAKFDELQGNDGFDDAETDGEDDTTVRDAFEPQLSTVREYVEKVAAPKHGDNGANAKSTVAGKNDMGGTATNIATGGEESGAGTTGGLSNPKTQELNGGNVNVPGAAAGKSAFSKKEPTPKAGDNGDNTQSLFRSRK